MFQHKPIHIPHRCADELIAARCGSKSGLQGRVLTMPIQNLAATQSRGLAEGDEFLDPETPQFVSASATTRKLLEQAEFVGPHLRIATIEGESGVGKHTLARLLYERYSARHPAVLQCGFTRSDTRDWLLSQSDPQSLAGFIFLDRVDLLAAPGQALLLRILKDLDFRHPGALVLVGSSESPLRDLARNGLFLTELAFRLASVRLTIPPLRDRNDDIIPLATTFLDRLSARYRLPRIILTPSAIARLIEYQWPGNVRELYSVLESAIIECSNGIIHEEDLALPTAPISARRSVRTPDLLNLDAVIHNHIFHVLDLNRGNKLRTARQLGISRSTLYRLLERRLSLTD
jgi:DNA-binding NtrC family response regulator